MATSSGRTAVAPGRDLENGHGVLRSTPSRPNRVTSIARRVDRDLLLLFAVLLIFTVIGVLWDVRYRHGSLFDIDESGYLGISLTDFHALSSGGIVSWIKAVEGPTQWSPITTLLSTPFYLLLGVRAISGLMSPLLLMLVAITAVFGLSRRVLPRSGMWMATILMATSPLVLDYSRDYIFSAAATAVAATALLCFQRSRQLESARWSILFGACIGALPLARTMTIAFIPAYLVLIAIAVAAPSDQRRTRLRNAGLAVLAGLIVAAAWLAFDGNATLVWDYLTQYGYGKAAQAYGVTKQHSLFSYEAWKTLVQDITSEVFLPQVILFAAATIAAVAVVIRRVSDDRRRALWPILTHPIAPAVVVVAEGCVALASSANNGDGFPAPLIPAFCVLTGWAMARALGVHRARMGAAVAVTGIVALLGVIPSLPFSWAVANSWRASVPLLGTVTITSGKGLITQYIAYPVSKSNQGSLASGRTWYAENAYAASELVATDPGNALVSFGFRHRLLNLNSVNLVRQLDDEYPVALTMVPRLDTGDTVRGYERWLTHGLGSLTCVLLTATGSAHEFTPTVTTSTMVAAARAVGFQPAGDWPPLPDGRVVTEWRRASSCPKS